MTQTIITIAIFLFVIILLILTTKDSYNIADEYWEGKEMSDSYRTPEEYAERLARDRGITVEEAKETAIFKEFEKCHEEEKAI